jgi:hypothetical protein
MIDFIIWVLVITGAFSWLFIIVVLLVIWLSNEK